MHIKTDNGSKFFLVARGMGGFLNPPGHAEYTFSIHEYGKGESHMSLTCAAYNCDWIPELVKQLAKNKLAEMPGDVKNEAWIASVYTYFHNCYSPDGVDRNVSHCICQGLKPELPPHWHLGYLFVKQFDPDHAPRLDLI